MNELVILARLSLSLLLGGLIGIEREAHGRPAGLRTHIMVSLGSCLIMLTSMYIFDIYRTSAPVDPSRIASGVITGIGFLGAGAILKEGEWVKGLTTASSLWVVAAIGLAVGSGFYKAGLFTTALALAVLVLMRPLERLLNRAS